jgi:hypothetical protein
VIVAVLSSGQDVHRFFAEIELSMEHSLYYIPPEDYENEIRKLPAETLFYIDIRDFRKDKISELIDCFSLLEEKNFGIIDPEGVLSDVGRLFHNGASDYISGSVFEAPFSPIRLKIVNRYILARETQPEPVMEIFDEKVELSGSNWTAVETGRNYTFGMLFAEVDDYSQWKVKLGSEQYEHFMRSFYTILNNVVEPLMGRFWMWSDTGGIVLFPFDGKNLGIIKEAFRLFMNRQIISTENPDFDIGMTYHLVIHVGETIYEDRGFTSELISDSVNSIFHIGNNFAKRDSLYITEKAEKFIPLRLREFFMDKGMYEGQHIKKMKKIHL